MALTENGKKVCSHCGRELDVEMFHKSSKSKDGLQSLCKECCAQSVRESYQRKKQKKQEESMLVVKRTGTTMNLIPLEPRTLDKFTSRELLQEIKRRGYRWTDMTLTQSVDFAKL